MQNIIEEIVKFAVQFWKWVGIIFLSWWAILLVIGGPFLLVREVFVYFFGRDKVYRFLNKDYDRLDDVHFGGPMQDL